MTEIKKDLELEEIDLNLVDYFNLIRFHISKIILVLFVGIPLTLYISYSKIPIYESKTSIMIEENTGSSFIMDFSGARADGTIRNEIQKINSRAVAEKVIEELWNSKRRNNLFLFGTRNYYLKGESYRRIVKRIFSFGFYKPQDSKKLEYFDEYSSEIGGKFSNKILKNMKVSNRKGTNIIEITYRSFNAHEAKLVVNKIATVYKKLEKKWGNDDAMNTVSLLKKLVLEQENKLHLSDETIKEYKLKNSIYNPEGNVESLLNQLNEYTNSLYNLNSELNISEEKKIILNSQLTESEKVLAKQLLTDLNSQMEILSLEISNLETRIIQYESQYGKQHDLVIEMQNRLTLLKENLNNNVEKLIVEGHNPSDPLAARQTKITELLIIESEIINQKLKINEIDKLKIIYNEKLTELPEKQLEFSRLLRELEIYSANYSFIRQKLEEAKIALASTSGKVQILDLAKINNIPITPNHKKDIMIGVFLSLFAAIFLVFIIEILDDTIKSPLDITKYKLTILGVIPSIADKFSQKLKIEKLQSKNKVQRTLITREDPRSPISEAYRSLRTNMLFTNVDKKVKSILVSSAGPGEGKTTTVANMAITYANLGKKTLLIDTDLRRPVIHKVLKLPKEPGITNYLSSDIDDFSSIIKTTEIKNLFAVTSGIIPPNPSELLGSNKMMQLVDKLEKEWDIILFDSPPLVAVTDATMVSKAIDKIIIVVKVGSTDKKAFEHTIQNLTNVGAPIGGIVLNAVTQNNSYGSYYYYYQYYNYYGEKK